jgi:hypothetical protein
MYFGAIVSTNSGDLDRISRTAYITPQCYLARANLAAANRADLAPVDL